MYTEHFGFTEKPFELSPNPKFFYLTTGHQSTLETILKGVQDRKGWIVLTGEVGTGKTMLVYGVLGQLPKSVKTAFIFHSTYRYGELLEQILQEVGERTEKKGVEALKNQVIDYLRTLKDRGEILAVLIDESQKLSQDVVQELFILLAWEPWVSETLQLVLVGQPELDEIIDAAVLKYRPPKPGLRVVIYPLNKGEARHYIEHRLRLVGSSSAPIFSVEALSLIIEYARGIPRLINITCDNALLQGYSGSLKRIGIKTIWEVIGNLEGPDYKKKMKFKPASVTSDFHFRFRYALVALLVLFLGAGIWLVQSRVKSPPILLKTWESVQMPVDKEDQAPPSPRLPEAKTPVLMEPASEIAKPQKTTLESFPPRESQLISLTGHRKIQVKQGDNLSRISLQYYGKFNKSLVDLISRHNPSIKDLDLILVDQVVQLPELTEETLLTPTQDQTRRIFLGTFLNREQAAKFKIEPALKGKKIIMENRKGSGQNTWIRVEAENYDSNQEALAALKTLRAKKLLPFF